MRVSPSASVRERTASSPTWRMSTFVARLSLVAPMSEARSAIGSDGDCRCCQMPESPTASRGARSSTVNDSAFAPMSREATSTKRSTLPIDAVGMTT